MNEIDVLVVIAELSVALVAAAGIVTAVGGRRRDYTAADRLRITTLIGFAAIPLAVCMFSIVLILASVESPLTWSLASWAQILLMALSTILGARGARDLAKDPDSRVTPFLVALSSSLSFSCACLLLYNALWLSAFWPVAAVSFYYLLFSVWLVLRLVLEST